MAPWVRLFLLAALVTALGAGVSSAEERFAAMDCAAWLEPSAVQWVRRALVGRDNTIGDGWDEQEWLWRRQLVIDTNEIMENVPYYVAARLVLPRYEPLHDELSRFAGRRDLPSANEAQELALVVHQERGLQSGTAAVFTLSAEFQRMPRVLLVSTTFKAIDGALLAEASEIRYSEAGEHLVGARASRVHLFGGYSQYCLSEAADDLIHRFLSDPSRRELELVFYSSYIYVDGVFGTMRDYVGHQGQSILQFPSVGMAPVKSSSITVAHPDGVSTVRAEMVFWGGKTLRITVR